jgi:hypothetical protein
MCGLGPHFLLKGELDGAKIKTLPKPQHTSFFNNDNVLVVRVSTTHNIGASVLDLAHLPIQL